MTAKLSSMGFIRPKKDNNQPLQTALADFKRVTGGFIQFYNLSCIRGNTQNHLSYIFKTPTQAQECATLLKAISNLDCKVTQNLLAIDHCASSFNRCARQSKRQLDKYRAINNRLKSVNYSDGWYYYYSVCYDLAHYKRFTYLIFRTEEQATQAIELLASTGQPTPFYLVRQRSLLFTGKDHSTPSKNRFLKRIKNIAYSERQLTELIALAGAGQTINYNQVSYYTLKASDPTINNTLYVLQERAQAEILADILNSQTTTENYGCNYSVVTARAYLSNEMQPAFNECVRLSLTKLINLVETEG